MLRICNWALGMVFVASSATASMIDEYLSARVGSFSSATQAAHDTRYDVVTWHVFEIWPDASANERWLYTEAWMDGEQAPYLQRVSSVAARNNGSLETRRFRITEPRLFLGAAQNDERFPDRSAIELIELEGCNSIVTRAGRGRFEGSTIGNNCSGAYKGASYTISRSVISRNWMINWDRGFDSAGKHVWGPQHGGYRFERIGAENKCAKPVRMLVYGDVQDRVGLGGYARALAKSGLYPSVGGYYEASTPPVAVFEGDPPASRGVIIARFPCLQAAKNFWYSDEYQNEIRPLRDGIAKFEVIVLDAPPLPAYVDH